MTAATIAEVASDMRTHGKVIWPWPPSILVDDPDVNIETYLVAAMNYLKTMAASGMPRGEEDQTSLTVAHGLIENGLRLTRTRREGSDRPRDEAAPPRLF